MKKNCLIVDDEPYAHEVLINYIHQVDFLNLVGACKSAMEAVNILREQKIDLLFLDIDMPLLNGIDFLKTLSNPPHVIITTAHRDYAIEGFELEVSDYLLKPIPFNRFIKAVNRVIFNKPTAMTSIEGENKKDHIFFKVEKRIVKVYLDEILYIESLKDYVKVKTRSDNFIVYQTMAALEEILPSDSFLRVQKSYIIATNKVRSIEGNMVEIGDKQITLSRSQKENLTNLILGKGISGFRNNQQQLL